MSIQEQKQLVQNGYNPFDEEGMNNLTGFISQLVEIDRDLQHNKQSNETLNNGNTDHSN